MRQWWTSLIARAIALLLTGLALTSAVVGSVFARIQSNRFRVEVERRGTSMLQMLDRHQDLRLALSLHDARATEEVLGQVLGSNSDIAYLGAVEAKGKVIASASRGVSERALSNHDLGGESARSDESTSRFTRRVTSDRDSGMGLPGEQSAAPAAVRAGQAPRQRADGGGAEPLGEDSGRRRGDQVRASPGACGSSRPGTCARSLRGT